MPPRFRLFLILCSLSTGTVHAAHITDKLVAGVYPKPDASLTPIQLVSSGMPVDVIGHKADFVEIRLADDTQGWVEARYVTDEKPAKAVLLETQAKLRQMGLQLAALREKQGLAAPGENAGQPAMPPNAREAKLQHELEDLRTQLAATEQRLADSAPTQAVQERADELQGRVNQALRALGATPESRDGQGPISRLQSWIVGLIALLVGFGGGIAFVDYRIRKRYGGFRI